MPSTRLKIIFRQLFVVRDASLWGPGTWYFTATIDGQRVGDSTAPFTARSQEWIELSADDWSLEIDVSKKKASDTIVLDFKARDKANPSKGDLGGVKITLKYPFKDEQDFFLPACEVSTMFGKKRYYYLNAEVKVLASTGAAGPGKPGQLFVSRQNKGSTTFSTLSGEYITPRVEICPVVPVPPKAKLPPRPVFPVGLAAGKVTDQSKAVPLTAGLALNALPNPAVIPVLKKDDPDLNKKAARIAVTYFEPGNLDTSHFTWHIKTGPAAFIGETDGKTEVMAYGTSSGETDEMAEIELRWDGSKGPLLAQFRAWVGGIMQVPLRATIIRGKADDTVPRATPKDVSDHIKMANVLMWHAGMLLAPDPNKGRWDGAVATAYDGIFSLKTKDIYTKAIDPNVPPVPTRLNSRPGAMHLAYIYSAKGDPAGVATDRPGLSGAKVDLDGTPSTSWVIPSGIKPDKAAGKVTMVTMAKSSRGTSDDDKKYAKGRTLSPQFWDHLWGVILPDYTKPDDPDWGQTVAHEIGHVLGLRHRGNGATDKTPGSDDEINDPTGTGYPNLENVMCYGYARSQDFDLIQASVIRSHPVTKNITFKGEKYLVSRAGKNVPHFSQGDPKWGQRILGLNKTIQQAGCAITSVTMILKYYGRDVTPKTLDEYLDKKTTDGKNDGEKGYIGDCVNFLVALKHSEDGQVKLKWGDTVTDPAEMEVILNERIDDDKPTLVRVDYGNDADTVYNHFVVVVGRTADGQWIMNDPASSKGDGASDDSDYNILQKTKRGGGYNLVRLDLIDPA